MELHMAASMLLLVCCGYLSSFKLVLPGMAIQSPQYTVVQSESEFEIRLYTESLWLSALVRGSSFNNSTKAGFHRLYQYIHGDNLKSTRFAMTAPVLTSTITTTDRPVYYVRIYLSTKSPPDTSPELSLLFDMRRSHCVVVRKFSGFAEDDIVVKEVEALVNSLNNFFNERTKIVVDKRSYTIAQYNSSRHLTGRLNEVWMNISGFDAEGCSN